MECINIKGYDLEYIDDIHCYLVDGVIVPSITQMLKSKFGNKYDDVSKATLQRAAELGTATHKAIEDYCVQGIEDDSQELYNFKFLMNQYNFTVLANEVPVILFDDGEPMAAGRLDLVLSIDGEIGLADIKRTSVLDKEYLAHQLNLYRLAYQQCYDKEVKFLKGIHLREDKRKFINIPINEIFIHNFIKDWRLQNGVHAEQ